MISEQIPTIKQLLSTPKRIVIIPHRNPDGDALGATLGLKQYLDQLQHNAVVMAPNEYPDFLKWLPGDDTVVVVEKDEAQCIEVINNADVIFTLDFNALHRIGDAMATVVDSAKGVKIMIDHHQQPDDYADFTYSDVSMSSTCEMVFNFIEMLGDTHKITPEIATCIYTGIMTDTGSFRFRSTTSRTHDVISQLIKKGANNTQIHANIYDTNTISRLHLLGVALKNLTVLPNFRTAYITLSQKELDTYNFKKGDTEGFVNYALSLKGIIFAAIFIENTKENIIKISLRSKGNFKVNEVSNAHFYGGGHNNAAGGRSHESLSATIDKFISILPTYKTQLDA